MIIINEREYITAREAAEQAGVSHSYICRMVRQGVLTICRVPFRVYLIDKESFERWQIKRGRE